MSGLQRVRGGLFEVALAFAGLVLGVAGFTALGATGLLPTHSRWAQWVGFIAGPAVTGLAAILYHKAAVRLDALETEAGGTPPRENALCARSRVPAGLWVVVGVLAAIAGSFVLSQVMAWLGAPVEEQSGILEVVEVARRGDWTVGLGVLAFSATLLAPVTEECLFRGLVFRRILGRGLVPEAYALSAASFAAVHTNLAGFVVYAWLGLVFAEVYRRTGKLWVAVCVHMGNNAFALGLLLWV